VSTARQKAERDGGGGHFDARDLQGGGDEGCRHERVREHSRAPLVDDVPAMIRIGRFTSRVGLIQRFMG
jgi:hypothetical protein